MTTPKRRPKADNSEKEIPVAQMWRFNKTFSLDTVVQLLGFAIIIGGPMLVWARVMDARVLKVETTQEAQEKREMQVLADDRERRGLLAVQMKELSDRTLAIQLDVAKLVATQSRIVQNRER